ncbi:antibiotic biosynthesis monooxygenase [Sphingomonas sp. HMWF008]|nr:antibiotic biosynthesis monooxygenase [Sphingomonas sp. HMWF008]
MIIVTGSVTARADSFDALLAASRAHVMRSRGEDGCISHAVHVDCDDPLRLFFFEQWRDQAALQRHFEQPGSTEFMTAVKALSASSDGMAIFDATPRAVDGE